MANLTHVELITPERVLFSGEAEAVVLRADGADTTFLANHMDYIGAVDICVLRLEGVQADGSLPAVALRRTAAAVSRTPLGEVRAAVHGGFVKVADNEVTIVAGVAELAEEIDVERAERALQAAEGRLSAGEAAEAAAAAARARVRIEAAVKLRADLSRLSDRGSRRTLSGVSFWDAPRLQDRTAEHHLARHARSLAGGRRHRAVRVRLALRPLLPDLLRLRPGPASRAGSPSPPSPRRRDAFVSGLS